MNLSFSSIHHEKTAKQQIKLSRPTRGQPMVPSRGGSMIQNSFKRHRKSNSNTIYNSAYLNHVSLNNTKISHKVVHEINKQSRDFMNTTVKKKPTEYTKLRSRAKKSIR